MIYGLVRPFSFHSTSAPSDTWETGGVMAYEAKQKIPHSPLSFLLASMSQWIFYKLSPEVYEHWERETERERGDRNKTSEWWGGGVLRRSVLASCMHGHLLQKKRTGRWQHLLHSSCYQGCGAQCLSVLRADPGFHLALLYDYHKRLDCLHKNVEWRPMPPLPLVAAFYWKGQVCPQGKAKTLTVLHSLSNRL